MIVSMTSTGTSFLPGNVGVRLVGGPTALIEMGGLRFLTDPTFDPPGDHPVGNRVLVKTRGPAVAAATSVPSTPCSCPRPAP